MSALIGNIYLPLKVYTCVISYTTTLSKGSPLLWLQYFGYYVTKHTALSLRMAKRGRFF